LCSDGVVIGCDSAELAGRSGQYTIERHEGVFKIELISGEVITAYTGATGLAQRFNDQITSSLRLLKQKFVKSAPVPGIGYIGTPLERFLSLHVPPGKVPYEVLNTVDIGRAIAQAVLGDFQGTQSMYQNQNGWGLGALFAFVKDDKPELIEFDPVQFHPQLKGQPDPERNGKDRNWRAVSMGAGKQLADAFLAHSYRLLFGDTVPNIERAKLVIVWTINHVCRYIPGWVGGPTHLAVLKKVNGAWRAQHENVDETQEQMVELERYITSFRVTPDAAAKDAADLDKELAKPQSKQ
jgi:hypothetical protein